VVGLSPCASGWQPRLEVNLVGLDLGLVDPTTVAIIPVRRLLQDSAYRSTAPSAVHHCSEGMDRGAGELLEGRSDRYFYRSALQSLRETGTAVETVEMDR